MFANKTFFKYFCFTGVALILGFLILYLIAEVTVRILGYEGDGERLNSVFDPYYGQVDKDSWVLNFHIDPETTKHIKINWQTISVEKPAGQRRILFIGDSGTVGAGVRLLDSFPFQFFGLWLTQYRDVPINVINAGVVGLTTIDEYHLLKNELVKLKPDVVVVGLFMANDINFNLAHAERRLDWKGIPWEERIFIFLRQHSAFMHYLFQRITVLNDKFRLSDRLNPGMKNALPVDLTLIDERGLNMVNYLEGEAALYFKDPSILTQEAYKKLEKVMDRFKILAQEENFELVFLLMPTSTDIQKRFDMLVYPDALEQLGEKIGRPVALAELDPEQPRKKVLEICGRLKLHCLDPIEKMRYVGVAALLPKNDHPSVVGHRLFAQELIENKGIFMPTAAE